MTDITWIMYTGMAAWAGIAAYLFFLGRKHAALARRVEQVAQLATHTEDEA